MFTRRPAVFQPRHGDKPLIFITLRPDNGLFVIKAHRRCHRQVIVHLTYRQTQLYHGAYQRLDHRANPSFHATELDWGESKRKATRKHLTARAYPGCQLHCPSHHDTRLADNLATPSKHAGESDEEPSERQGKPAETTHNERKAVLIILQPSHCTIRHNAIPQEKGYSKKANNKGVAMPVDCNSSQPFNHETKHVTGENGGSTNATQPQNNKPYRLRMDSKARMSHAGLQTTCLVQKFDKKED